MMQPLADDCPQEGIFFSCAVWHEQIFKLRDAEFLVYGYADIVIVTTEIFSQSPRNE